MKKLFVNLLLAGFGLLRQSALARLVAIAVALLFAAGGLAVFDHPKPNPVPPSAKPADPPPDDPRPTAEYVQGSVDDMVELGAALYEQEADMAFGLLADRVLTLEWPTCELSFHIGTFDGYLLCNGPAPCEQCYSEAADLPLDIADLLCEDACPAANLWYISPFRATVDNCYDHLWRWSYDAREQCYAAVRTGGIFPPPRNCVAQCDGTYLCDTSDPVYNLPPPVTPFGGLPCDYTYGLPEPGIMRPPVEWHCRPPVTDFVIGGRGIEASF